MNVDSFIVDLFSLHSLGVAMGGAAAAFFLMMTDSLSHYELYGEFLICFSLSLLFLWWYPQYVEAKQQ